MHAQLLSHVPLLDLWTVASQAPLYMGFPRKEYWSGLPFPPPGHLPNPGTESMFSVSPELAGGFFTTEPPGKPYQCGSCYPVRKGVVWPFQGICTCHEFSECIINHAIILTSLSLLNPPLIVQEESSGTSTLITVDYC